MKLCGNCGTAMECIKTGLAIKNETISTNMRLQADLHGCPTCGNTFLNTAESYYHSEQPADCTIMQHNEVGSVIFFSKEIAQLCEERLHFTLQTLAPIYGGTVE